MSYNSGGSGGKGFGFAGFTMPKRNPSNISLHAVPPPSGGMHAVPPPSTGLSKQGYSTMSSITQNAMSGNWANVGKKRSKTEDEYFDEDDEPSTPALAYIPAPGSPSYKNPSGSKDNEDEEDPLDAYMAGLEQQAAKDLVTSKENAASGKDTTRGTRGDIDELDDEESYYKYMEENPLNANDDGSDIEIEYDEDGNPIPPPKKKFIDPLPPIDHSEIEYEPFEKNFYTPHEEIDNLTHQQVEELKKTLGIKISGPDPPKPVTSFAHFGFDEQLMKAIRKSEYTQPTPIQAAGIPAALSGRDLIGIARTGSGKTAAFLWPLLIHIMDQKELGPGDGPIGLILAPTRELAQQIYMEAKRFGKVYNIRCVCCYGGGSKWEQTKALEDMFSKNTLHSPSAGQNSTRHDDDDNEFVTCPGMQCGQRRAVVRHGARACSPAELLVGLYLYCGGAEIIVGTPGRIIDLIKCKATSLSRVTYLVLDEADRMFDMGFEPQVRSICNHVRPDRQALLFSATFPRKVERLVRDALHDPVRVQHGAAGEASGLVRQHVQIFNTPDQKWQWLLDNLVEFLSAGSILIFVTKKLEAEQTAANLGVQQYDALLLHGDMGQAERNKVITSFKRHENDILVATDVAARGLDIPHIRTVINFTVARDIDTHTHRVGRTGRAGVFGDAHTLMLRDKDREFAGHLVRNLEGASQEVPEELMQLAMQSSWFRKSRFKKGKGKNLNIGGCGLGYKERPGLPNKPDIDELASIGYDKNSGGPATDRLSSLRQAFKAQYSQFTASSDHSWEQTRPVFQPGVNAPANPDAAASSAAERVRKSGKRSRWE
ncbi:ATP-dependent RNA helicase DDX42 [Eumeta japonica]|uniref:RNA helicase n=1 Tax=Eumeta variegata TaxID=151549 RepID=A0A4C1TQ22_EUMVA|nr:ATP-dependent RNA helicase DDX42 [Eumeta japonica]